MQSRNQMLDTMRETDNPQDEARKTVTKPTQFVTGLLVAMLLGQVGCQSLPTGKMSDWKIPLLNSKDKKASSSKKTASGEQTDEEDIEYGIPVKLAVIWTDSTFTAAGARATRGFGGRFFFYDQEGTPIPVKGELIIYGFDDSRDSSQQKIPDRKFVFRSDELQKHRSIATELGMSYSFWIPWDAVGGERKTISLLPLLKLENGQVVRGEIAVNVLPGRPPEDTLPGDTMERDRLTESFTYPSSQVGFVNESNAVLQAEGTRMKAATINVPQGLGDQLQRPQGTQLSWERNRAATTTAERQGNALVGTGPAPGFGNQAPMNNEPATTVAAPRTIQEARAMQDRYPSSTQPNVRFPQKPFGDRRQ